MVIRCLQVVHSDSFWSSSFIISTRQHPKDLNLINGLLHFYTEVYAPPHRSARTASSRFPHRCVPQSTSLCELPRLHLSSLVCKAGDIITTNQIESERDSFQCHSSCRYRTPKNWLFPSSVLLTGHSTLFAQLVSGQTSAHILTHLHVLLYHYRSSRYLCACSTYICSIVVFHVHFVC